MNFLIGPFSTLVDHAIELCKNMGAELIAVSVVNMESVSGIEKTDGEVYRRVQLTQVREPSGKTPAAVFIITNLLTLSG